MTLRSTTTMFCIGSLMLACGSDADAPGSAESEATANGEGAGDVDPGTGLPHCTPDSPVGEPCVDDMGARRCPVDSGYAGDDLALCDLDPSQGMVIHYGPSDYDDPDAVAPFLIGPGEDRENCTFAYTPNEEDQYFKAYHGRLRPQSHHLIVTTITEGDIDESALPTRCSQEGAVGSRWLVGSQDPQIDVLVGGGLLAGEEGAKAPQPGDPDYGLAQRIEARTPVRINVHYVNTTDETILREAWVGFTHADEEEVEDLVDMITFFQGRIEVPPKSAATTGRGACVADTDRYVGLVTGHAHQHLTRFSIWHEKEGGDSDLIYETYDYAEPGNLFYRDGIENPLPDPERGLHGGSSGYLFVKAGEAVSFECEYYNPFDHTVTLGNTGADEMCNVFGMYYPTDGNVWSCGCLDSMCLSRFGGLGGSN